MNGKSLKGLVAFTTVLILLVAVPVGIVAFQGFKGAAIDLGYEESIANLFPISTEGGVFVLMVVAFTAYKLGIENINGIWVLIALFSVVSGLFSMMHAPTQTWEGWLLAAWPVAVFFFVTKAGLWLMQKADAALGHNVKWETQARRLREKVAELVDELSALRESEAQARERMEKAERIAKEAAGMKAELLRVSGELAEARPILEAWAHMNERTRLQARMNAGQIEAHAVAEIVGLDVSTIRKAAKSMNGVAHG